VDTAKRKEYGIIKRATRTPAVHGGLKKNAAVRKKGI